MLDPYTTPDFNKLNLGFPPLSPYTLKCDDFFVCGLKVSSSKYLFDNSYFVSTWRTGGVLPMVIRFAPPPPNHTHTRIHLLKKSTCGFMFVVHQSTYQNPNLES